MSVETLGWQIYDIMVNKFQNEFLKALFLPKYERKIVRISALYTVGQLFIFGEKR